MPKTPSYLKTDLRLRSSYPQALPPSAHPLICTNASPHHVTGEGQPGVILKGVSSDIMQPRNSIPTCSPSGNESIPPHKKLYKNVHGNFIQNSQEKTMKKIKTEKEDEKRKKDRKEKRKTVSNQPPPECPSAGSSNCGPSTQVTGMLLASKKE